MMVGTRTFPWLPIVRGDVSLAYTLIQAYSQLENAVVSMRRIYEMATLTPENDPGADGAVIPSKKDLWPQHGSVVFEKVSLKYRYVKFSANFFILFPG